MERDGGVATNCNWWALDDPERLGKGTGRTGNQKKNQNNPDYGIAENGQNTEMSPRDLRWLAITQTPVKDH